MPLLNFVTKWMVSSRFPSCLIMIAVTRLDKKHKREKRIEQSNTGWDRDDADVCLVLMHLYLIKLFALHTFTPLNYKYKEYTI